MLSRNVTITEYYQIYTTFPGTLKNESESASEDILIEVNDKSGVDICGSVQRDVLVTEFCLLFLVGLSGVINVESELG